MQLPIGLGAVYYQPARRRRCEETAQFHRYFRLVAIRAAIQASMALLSHPTARPSAVNGTGAGKLPFEISE
jgi:hypothetical protein